MRKWNGKRILSIGLALVLCFSCTDMTAFAAESDSAEERQESQQETLTDVSDIPEGGDETSDSEDEKAGENIQNPDEKKDGENEQNPEEGKEGDNARNPEEGKEGDNAQNPEEGNAGDNVQNPEDGKDEDATQNPEDKKDEDGAAEDVEPVEKEPETPDGEEAPDTDDQKSVSENDSEEQETSVSENELGTISAQSVTTAAENEIARGQYENTEWWIDANGKLTVTGTGEFAPPASNSSTPYTRTPWYAHKDKIKSAVIRLTGTKDASYLFGWCSKLTDVDLSGFDTSEVTDMSGMFWFCWELPDVDLSGFDTSKVTNMNKMFYKCYKLQEVDVSHFDTAAVTDMGGMFGYCEKFTELDLRNFRTDNVKNMEQMFVYCYNLTGLDLSRFQTDQVTNMAEMFKCCKKFKELELDNFKTGNVTKMNHMFQVCESLTSLDLSSFDTSNVTDMTGMFSDCESLTSLDLSSFDTSKVTDMAVMFSNIYRMETIDLSSFDTGKVIDMTSMFSINDPEKAKEGGFKRLDLSNFNTSQVRKMASMFYGLNLTELDLSSFDTSQVVNMDGMFENCKNLAKLDLSSFDTSETMYMSKMFQGCESLTELDLSSFSLPKAWTIAWMFDSCSRLQTIYTPYNLRAAADQGDKAYDAILPVENEGDKWYRSDDKTEITALPKELSYSILVTRNKIPEVTARIAVRKTKTAYACGEAITLDDLTVTCYGADGSVKKLTADQYTTNAAQIDMTGAGEKKLVVTYVNGGTSLTAEITLTVTYGLTADNTTVTLPAEDYTYDGQPKQPVPTAVSYTQNAAGGAGTPVILSEGTDYTLSYRNNINAYEPSAADGSVEGTGENGAATAAPTVIIKGAGKYSGSVRKTFVIQKAAAPAAETMDVTGSQCTQAQPKRTADLTGSFTACGKKTGYEVLSVEDPKGIFSKTPVTADIKDGVLTYGTKAAQEGDTASLKIKVSFANYKDAELTVRITMAAKKAAVISGIAMEESAVYSGMSVSYGGEAAVKTEDGRDITGQVSLVYQYSGVMADGTAYPAQGGTAEPPVNAGSYVLTVSVSDDNPDYVGSASYPFAIRKADAVVQAKDLTVLMQLEGEGSTLVPVEQYQKDFGYTVTGLFNADTLRTEPTYTVTEDEAGTKTVNAIDTSKAGAYYIHPSAADAGMNYALAYKPGILTVSEERVAHTVTFDGMGRCDTCTKSGIKSGALLELTEEERTPAAKEQGYVFAGWFKDKTFDRKKEWNFETDTVQSDLTLYACWMTAADQDGAGLKLCVQEIPDLTYTGNAWKPAVTVYDSDGTTLLKAGKDYTVKYVRNTDAVEMDENGRPKEAGGTAKVKNPGKANEQLTDVAGHFSKDCPYVVITGKGNYTETVYRNFLILPAQIAADSEGQTYDTPLAAGFTMKYTNQFEAKVGKTAKIVSSVKYKKALKEGKDYSVSVADASGQNVVLTQGKMPLNAGSYTMTVTGKGNYTGVVTRKLYVAEKQKLMKNVSITLGRNQKTRAYTGEDVLLTPGYYDAGTKKNHKVTSEGVVGSTPEPNANDMFLVKAGKESLVWGTDYTIDYAGTNRAVGTATMTLTGKNGYVGTKSVTFKITGTPFSAKTINVKAYDAAHPNEKDWKASMSYTGRAVTQNQVTLTTKVTQKNPAAKELVYGEHYTIAYKNNVKKGTATVTFMAKPESGYSGSFKKTFKITAQELAKERLTVTTSVGGDKMPEAVYSKNGAKLSLTVTNEAGAVLREGTDYTVKYKNNNAVTTAQTPENKKPLMTVMGKGNYAGKVEVSFMVVQASLASALDEGIVQISCAQVQKKNGMKFKDLKFKLKEGKKTLGVGETKDYIIDETGCTPEIFKAYADAVATGTALPQEPVVKVTGKGHYSGEKTIALGKYIYADKLTSACVYVVVSEGAGQNIYTGGQVTPDVAVYYGEKTGVSAAKKDKVKDDAALTTSAGKYKLKKLATDDYILSYGANIAAGKNKGSVTITGAGRYGGNVTVKFEIGKKAIY